MSDIMENPHLAWLILKSQLHTDRKKLFKSTFKAFNKYWIFKVKIISWYGQNVFTWQLCYTSCKGSFCSKLNYIPKDKSNIHSINKKAGQHSNF
jgi:hypothetical protein